MMSYFSGVAGSEAFLMKLIGIDKGGKVVCIGWGDLIMWMLVEFKIRLFSIAES